MDKLFDRNRLPDGIRVIPLLMFLPVGILLGFIRFFIGLQTLLAAALLQKITAIRAVLIRGMCCTLGLVVREENSSQRKESVSVIVSNHVSILDHIAFHLATGSYGMSAQNAPILVQLAFHFKSLEKSRVTAGEIVDLQPEGAITNCRHGLLKFKTVPSSLAKEVQPATLRIWRPALTDVSSNTLGATWFADLLWFLIVPVTIITIKYLPTLKQNDEETDDEWTRRIEKSIADDLGIETTDFTAANKAELERQLLPVDTQLRLIGPAHMAVRLKETYPSLPLEAIRAEIERTQNVTVAIENLKRMLAKQTAGAADERKSEFDTAASVFPKSAHDRMASFQERKTRLIETARKRYLEKRALNVASS